MIANRIDGPLRVEIGCLPDTPIQPRCSNSGGIVSYCLVGFDANSPLTLYANPPDLTDEEREAWGAYNAA